MNTGRNQIGRSAGFSNTHHSANLSVDEAGNSPTSLFSQHAATSSSTRSGTVAYPFTFSLTILHFGVLFVTFLVTALVRPNPVESSVRALAARRKLYRSATPTTTRDLLNNSATCSEKFYDPRTSAPRVGLKHALALLASKKQPCVSSSMTLLRLPTELLSEIASYVPDRHPVWGYMIDSYFLSALSITCRKLRFVSLPYLYRETLITSERQLRSLVASPLNLLRLIRELNIFMDGEFVDAWKIGVMKRQTHSGDHESNIFDSFATILCRTPGLHTLRIRIAELTGQRSGWRKFALVHPFGIPIGHSLEEALRSTGSVVTLPALQTLELDGFEDIAPLLRLTPNLDRLRVSLSAGFWRGANTELIEALKYVPKLHHLTYTPSSLGLSSLNGDGEIPNIYDDIGSGTGYSSVQLLKALGAALPDLETLDLRTRWFSTGYSIFYCSTSEPLCAMDLISAFNYLPHLKYLALPSSVISPEDFAIVRTPLPKSTLENALDHLPALRTSIETRRETLTRTESSERETVEQIGLLAPDIKHVSFVRNVYPETPIEYEVKYAVRVHSDRISPLRPARAEVVSMELARARDDQSAPWPFAPTVSLAYTLRRLWSTNPSSGPMSFSQLEGHHGLAGLLVASAGGCIVGEASRELLRHTENPFVASVLVGGTLYACARLATLE